MVTSVAVTLSLFVVTQTSQPASIEVFATSSSSSALQADRRDVVRAFLADRVRDAFGINVGPPPLGVVLPGPAYAVGLHWESADRVLVEVSRHGDLLASRTLDVQPEITRTCADAWMLIRSAIERDDLTDPTPPIEETPAIATTTAATEVAAEPEPTPVPAPAVVPAVVTKKPQPKPTFGLQEIKSISATLMTEAAVQGSFGAGPAASVSVELTQGVVLGASLAYRSITHGDSLEVTRMPFSLRAGYVPVNSFDLETGVSLALDLGVASTTARDDAVIGIHTGPYVRGRLPFTEWEGAQVSAVMEMGIAIALLRSSYYVRGEEYGDGLLSARALAGVEWRWR